MKKMSKSLLFTVVLNFVLILLTLFLIFNGTSVLTVFNVTNTTTVMGDYVTNLIGVLIGGILGVELAVFADRISSYLNDAKEQEYAYRVAKSVLINDFRTRVNLIKTDIIREEMAEYKYVSEYINYHGLVPEADASQLLSFKESNSYLFAIEEYLGKDFDNLRILREIYEKPQLFRQYVTVSMNVFRKELQQIFQQVEDKLQFFEEWELDRLKRCAPFSENNDIRAYINAVSSNASSFVQILCEKAGESAYKDVSSRDRIWLLMSYEAVLTYMYAGQGTMLLGLPGDVPSVFRKDFELFKKKYMSLLLQDNTEVYYQFGLEISANIPEDKKSDYRKFMETMLGKVKYTELLEYDFSTITVSDFTKRMRELTLESQESVIAHFLRDNTTNSGTEFENKKLEKFFVENTRFYDDKKEHTAEEYIKTYFSDYHAVGDKLVEKLKPLETEATCHGNLAQKVFDLVMLFCWPETMLSWSYNIAFESIKLRYELLPCIDEVIMKEDYILRDSNNRFAIKFVEIENAFEMLGES